MRPQTGLSVSALGEEFRSAREARSLSLSDVAERLHIRSVYLAAIEDEDWHVIGAPVYVRGFMRTYARFLGLDPEAAVARFTQAVPAGTPAATTPRPAANPGEKRGMERSSPSLAAIVSILVAVLVVAFVGYEFFQYRSGTPAAVPVADSSGVPADSAAAGVAAGTAAPAATSDAQGVAAIPPVAPTAVPGAKRGLSLQVMETSWLRVTVDGNVVLEGTLPAGSAKSFTGKVADLRVGNAGGVRIAVNGRTLGPLGANGDVVERHLVLSGG
jgi:cytoskeleton protein RodZ